MIAFLGAASRIWNRIYMKNVWQKNGVKFAKKIIVTKEVWAPLRGYFQVYYWALVQFYSFCDIFGSIKLFYHTQNINGIKALDLITKYTIFFLLERNLSWISAINFNEFQNSIIWLDSCHWLYFISEYVLNLIHKK